MKRMIFLVTLMLMMSLVFCAAAEGTDLAAMSLDELVELRNTVQTEIDNRIGEAQSMPLGVGYYRAGADIPAGRYEIACTNRVNEDYEMEVIVLSEDSTETFWLDVGSKIYMNLGPNDAFQVEAGNGIISKSKGLFMD